MSSITYEFNNIPRWREYFEDILNPVEASTRDTHEVTQLGKERVFSCSRSGNGN